MQQNLTAESITVYGQDKVGLEAKLGKFAAGRSITSASGECNFTLECTESFDRVITQSYGIISYSLNEDQDLTSFKINAGIIEGGVEGLDDKLKFDLDFGISGGISAPYGGEIGINIDIDDIIRGRINNLIDFFND